MATTMRQHFPGQGHTNVNRTAVQKVCIGMGIAFILVGLAGIVMPGLMGMHLSMAHNLIHLASGALALWAGFSDESRKAYTYCVAFGAVYGLLGVFGFAIGEPGYPGVGHMEADQNLLRVVPNVLEFGSSDHAIHILIAAVLITSAMFWKKNRNGYRGKLTTRPEVPNSDTDLPHADLGRSDVNRTSDLNRRADFERKL